MSKYRPIKKDSDIRPVMMQVVTSWPKFRGNLTKSALLSRVTSFVIPGDFSTTRYFDSEFQRQVALIQQTFEELVAEEILVYTPRQPLKLGAGYVPEEVVT